MWLLWILSLAAASFLLPATGEVVDSFNPCKKFFLGGKPPKLRPMNPARICQLYENSYRFATMYDKDRRIPTFSAYKFQPGQGQRWEDWKIEPQLALPKDHHRKSMESEETCGIDRNILEKSQAVDRDYREGALYDRGHLAPALHQPDEKSKNATFTLTNIVPQFRQLNNGQWAAYETNMSRDAAECKETYVIVGAVPGNKEPLNKRVNIPSHVWAAVCCVLPKKQKKSWAVIAPNDENKVDHLTLEDLQKQLANLYKKKTIDLFNNACNTAPNPQNRA